jgi:hypothetical protein
MPPAVLGAEVGMERRLTLTVAGDVMLGALSLARSVRAESSTPGEAACPPGFPDGLLVNLGCALTSARLLWCDGKVKTFRFGTSIEGHGPSLSIAIDRPRRSERGAG